MTQPHDDRKHRAILVQVGPWSEQIDVAIAPLIREMWIAGIETDMSCECDGYGKIWISFAEMPCLERFLNIVAEHEAGAETLYDRMNPQLLLDDAELAWDYDMFVDDAGEFSPESQNVEDEHRQRSWRPDFYFTFSVRFPPSDLARVLQRMQQHNRDWPKED